MGFITGKSTQKSSNQAYPYLKDALGGAVSAGTGALGMAGNLLGTGDSAAGQAAMQNWQNSTGFQSQLDAGSRAITGNAATRGLLRSGSTGKALMNFGQDLGKQSFSTYLQQLLGMSGQGLQAANTIGGAGNVSQSKSKPGMGSTIGAAMSMIPSDPRLKTDIDMIGTADNGLGIYTYRYIWDPETVHTGYMADEVAELAPDALGPELPGGYMTVDYSKLPPIEVK